MSDDLRYVSDGLKNLSDGVRTVSDSLRSMSDGLGTLSYCLGKCQKISGYALGNVSDGLGVRWYWEPVILSREHAIWS